MNELPQLFRNLVSQEEKENVCENVLVLKYLQEAQTEHCQPIWTEGKGISAGEGSMQITFSK